MAKCTVCGADAGFGMNVCATCREKRMGIDPEGLAREAEIKEMAKAIVITTAPNLEGYKVIQTIDVITAECVFGLNVFKDFFAGMSDLLGGRSETTQNALRDARKTALSELRKEAALVGANAIIGVKLDYSEFSGQGKSMLFLVASGTAVSIEPL